jgi:5'-nucleotidase
MRRRDFLQQSLLATATFLLPWDGAAWATQSKKSPRRLTILHTNDMHSRIEPFPNDGSPNAGLGGMARRASMISQIRKQDPDVLLLDSGDIFQGTPYFNFFGGELEFKLMSRMGYDAATLGNHDFDNGLEGLDRQLPHAGFPFLIANYDFSNTILKNRFQPYRIFDRAGLKIGVFGLGIELQGLVLEKNHGNTRYLDPIATARLMVAELQRQGCHMIICLSHLGYQYDTDKVSDHTLAQQVDGIDLILGGHTHTFLDQPTVLKSPNGREVVVNQASWAGLRLGRIEYVFLPREKWAKVTGTSLLIGDEKTSQGVQYARKQ